MPNEQFNNGEQLVLANYENVMNKVKTEFDTLRQNSIDPVIADQSNVYATNNEGSSNSNSNARVRVLKGPNSHATSLDNGVDFQPNNIFSSLRVPEEEPVNYINNNSAFSYVLVIFLALILIFLLTILILGLSGVIH